MRDERIRHESATSAPSIVRFGPYELDLRTAELRKNDLKVSLQDQPFQILVALLEHPGEVVLREELRRRLWGNETVVEFDHGINAAVKRLRDALRESAEHPRYIETLARRGYRFIGKLESLSREPTESILPETDAVGPVSNSVANGAHPINTAPVETFSEKYLGAAENPPTTLPFSPPRRKKFWIVLGGLTLVLLATALAVIPRMRSLAESKPEMTRLTFDAGLTTDPAVSSDAKLLAYATDRSGSGHLHVWVQQFMPDGPAMQLTHGDADDHQPAFSPDGSKIAFRSERDGGGIYVIPTIGGEAVLIARGGRDPRFSPDGRWIAYWHETMMAAPFAASAGTVDVVASAGGTPQRVAPDLTEAGVPVWSDDSKHLVVFGRKDELPPPVGDWNWWVVPLEGGPATSTGAFALLRAKGFLNRPVRPEMPRVANWHAGELLFSARLGDSTSIWKLQIDSSTSRARGDPQRLTSGTGLDAYPSLTADGHLVFAGLTNSSDVWVLPADTNAAKAIGQPQRVTGTIGPHQFASLSTDGRLLAYSSVRYGRPRAWIKNLETGAEMPVSNGTASECMPHLSSDASLVVYNSCGENGPSFVVPLQGGTSDRICTGCATVYDVSPDNRVVLYRKESTVRAFDLFSRRDTLFMQHAKAKLYQHRFSPDRRWVAFEAVHANRSRLYVAALRDSIVPAPEIEWIALTGDEGWADKPRWSPDGNVIYFISNRDGFFCLWAQRLAPASKQPAGPPTAIAHFHGSRLSVGNVGSGAAMEIAVARNKIALNLGELTGNIWATNFSH